jgi:hypothetical protein
MFLHDTSVAEARRRVVAEMNRREERYFQLKESLICDGNPSGKLLRWLRLFELGIAGTMHWMNHAQRYTRAGKHPEYAPRDKDRLEDLLCPESGAFMRRESLWRCGTI